MIIKNPDTRIFLAHIGAVSMIIFGVAVVVALFLKAVITMGFNWAYLQSGTDALQLMNWIMYGSSMIGCMMVLGLAIHINDTPPGSRLKKLIALLAGNKEKRAS